MGVPSTSKITKKQIEAWLLVLYKIQSKLTLQSKMLVCQRCRQNILLEPLVYRASYKNIQLRNETLSPSRELLSDLNDMRVGVDIACQ